MTTLVPLSRTARRLGSVAVAGVLAVAATLAAAPGASAAAPTVVNCSTTNLQNAINNADAGATMDVTGTCSGNYIIPAGTNITLVGQGRGAVLKGTGGGTTLTVSSGATAELNNVTVTGGNANGSTEPASDGGGIYNSGTLTLLFSTVSGNSANNYGGGIYNNDSAGLTLMGTTVSGNSSAVFGGGVYNTNAMSIDLSNVSGNTAALAGGGVFTGFGFAPVTLTHTTVSDNSATTGSGGGVFNILDSVTLNHSTVSGNTASLEGGGIVNNAGTTTLDHSYVTGNTATSGSGGSFGGGVFTFSGNVLLTASYVTGNAPDNCEPSGDVTGCTG